MTDAKTFTIPEDVAAYCAKAAEALRSSEKMLREEIELSRDDADPHWTLSLPPRDAEICAHNIQKASEFLDWLARFEAAARSANPQKRGADD